MLKIANVLNGTFPFGAFPILHNLLVSSQKGLCLTPDVA
jgi:hypothetical protein